MAGDNNHNFLSLLAPETPLFNELLQDTEFTLESQLLLNASLDRGYVFMRQVPHPLLSF